MGRLLFPAVKDGLPATAGPVPGHLWSQIVKDLSNVRGRLGALLLITRSFAHLAHSAPGGGDTDWKSWYLVLAEKGCSRKGGKHPQGSRLLKLVAAAQKEEFGAKPGSAVRVGATLADELLIPQ